MKGYFKVNLTEDCNLPKSSSRCTGEQRLALIEKTLRKDGIEFVEDFEGNSVIVRYGEFVNDAAWDAYQARFASPATIDEPAEVCV